MNTINKIKKTEYAVTDRLLDAIIENSDWNNCDVATVWEDALHIAETYEVELNYDDNYEEIKELDFFLKKAKEIEEQSGTDAAIEFLYNHKD